MNHAELCAYVAQCEKEGKPHICLPLEWVAELCTWYKKPEPPAFLYMGTSLETEA